MNETNYRIRYKKDNFEVEVQGDKDWVEKKFGELTTKEIVVAGAKGKEVEGMPPTLVEFLGVKGNPKKHTDIMAVFAYWLLKVEKMDSFNVNDVLACYDTTKKTKPKNPNQTINNNIGRKVFAEAKEKKDELKAWFITDTGQEHVEKMK
jgi:hypothetical protein